MESNVPSSGLRHVIYLIMYNHTSKLAVRAGHPFDSFTLVSVMREDFQAVVRSIDQDRIIRDLSGVPVTVLRDSQCSEDRSRGEIYPEYENAAEG